MKTSIALSLVALVIGSYSIAAHGAEPPKMGWKKIVVDDKFRGEGCTVGDLNHDGKLDIIAGPVYYAAPDWKMVTIDPTPENIEKGPWEVTSKAGEPWSFDPLHYSHSFVNAAVDLNGDGWLDVIEVDFPAYETWWFENPKDTGGPWKKHLVTKVTNNESPGYYDLFGDGKKVLLMGVSKNKKSGPERQMAYLTPDADPNKPWVIHTISAKGSDGANQFSHGLGVGDVNKDGRKDVVIAAGWYEQPADKNQAEWEFHPFTSVKGEREDKSRQPCSQMQVYDVDGDGDMDVISCSAHGIGMWWNEQTPEGWKSHEFSRDCSQTHSTQFVDFNGDGVPELVTGERFWAHGPVHEGTDPPAVVLMYELKKKDGKPEFVKHEIDNDSGVGTAFEVADLDGDGLLDIITSNKKGTRWFKQTRE